MRLLGDTPCRDGDGNEICGFDLSVQTTGGVSIDPGGFSAEPGDVYTETTSLLRATGGNPTNGDTGPMKIGDLSVSASGTRTVELIGNQWVDADVGLNAISSAVIAVTGAGPLDLLLFNTSFGKKRSKSVCAFTSEPCDVYDLTGTENLINANDLFVFRELYGKKLKARCPQCGPPYPDPNLPCAGDACP